MVLPVFGMTPSLKWSLASNTGVTVRKTLSVQGLVEGRLISILSQSSVEQC